MLASLAARSWPELEPIPVVFAETSRARQKPGDRAATNAKAGAALAEAAELP
jgi:hypothetical protein